MVGLFGLLNVLRGGRPSGEPEDPVVRRIEGWILGLDAAHTTIDRRPASRMQAGGDSTRKGVL